MSRTMNELSIGPVEDVTQDSSVITTDAGAFGTRAPDALNCSEAGTVEIIDIYGRTRTVTLVAGWNPQACRAVTSNTAVTTVKAGWTIG